MAPRVVRSNLPPKGKGAGRHKPASDESCLCVYVAENNRLAAQYLLEILAKDTALKAAPLEDLIVNAFVERKPTAFVLDRGWIGLPLGDCIQVLRKRYPDAKFVILDEERTHEEIAFLVSLGIHGFVAYSHISDQLTQAVRQVVHGSLWISAGILEAYVRHSVPSLNSGNEAAAKEEVTQRERQVIELVKRRLSNKEIGAMLKIKEGTVKFHLSNIFSKLQLKRRRELHVEGEVNEIWKRLMAS